MNNKEDQSKKKRAERGPTSKRAEQDKMDMHEQDDGHAKKAMPVGKSDKMTPTRDTLSNMESEASIIQASRPSSTNSGGNLLEAVAAVGVVTIGAYVVTELLSTIIQPR